MMMLASSHHLQQTMSKKRAYHQMSGSSTSSFYPSITKRRKISPPNHHVRKQNSLEYKEEEYDGPTSHSHAFRSNAMSMSCDSDSDSIASVMESVCSSQSDSETVKFKDADPMTKLQEHPQLIIPQLHLTQNICILGGNYKYLQSLLPDITNRLQQVIYEHNYKLIVYNEEKTKQRKSDHQTKLAHSLVGEKLIQKQHLHKIAYQTDCRFDDCDVCLCFPDININLLSEAMQFINSQSTNLKRKEAHRLVGDGKYTKKVIFFNLSGFFNGLRLQIMNFTSTATRKLTATNVVFVNDFEGVIQQLRQWSK